MRTEIKKALCKHTRKDKKHLAREADSDSGSNDSTWRGGLDSTGELNTFKKRKLNSLLKNILTPDQIKLSNR